MPGVHVNHPLDGGGESIAAMIFKDRGDESNGKEEGGGGGGHQYNELALMVCSSWSLRRSPQRSARAIETPLKP